MVEVVLSEGKRDVRREAVRIAIMIVAIATISPACLSTLGAQGRMSTFVAGVADAETGQPLEGAEVILLDAHRLARANGLGEATIDWLPPGKQRVRVRKLGYTPVEVDVVIARDTSGAVFRLQRSVVKLGVVDIEADWVPPKMRDVQVRQRLGIGRFLNETQLAKEADREFSVVMASRFPGLKAVLDSTGHFVLASTREQLTITASNGNNIGRIPVCAVSVYIDDVLIERSDEDLIRTWDVAVVEFYDGLQVPVGYRTKAYGCGVLLVWSKWY